MSAKKHFYLFFGLVILIAACNKNSGSYRYTMAVYKKIKLPIDSVTRPIQINGHILGDDTLIILEENNTLLFYNLVTQKLFKKITFNRQGPDGISQVSGFLYLNKDTIFLLNATQYKLFIANEAKKITRTYNLSNYKDSEAPSMGLSNYFAQMVKVDNQIHIATYPYLKPESQEFYKSKKIHQVVDLQSGANTYLPTSYPNIYVKNPYPYIFSYFYRCFNNDEKKFVYSFMASDNIIVTDNNSPKNIEFVANANMKPPQKLENFTFNEEEHLRIQGTSNFYYSIYYDKYRKVYYRFASRIEKNGHKTWIIIVLDKDFNKILEFDYLTFPPEKRFISSIFPFVAKDGLYLPDKDSQTEDFFEIIILRLQKID
ncbi:MAG: DUF4221 family protein [Thermonemataceae bacterium]|nr:DUF4221 family protein [Thermonemataceae bacterium]